MSPAYDPAVVASQAKKLTKGAAKAVSKMSADWQFCGKATFDANGAHNAYWKARDSVERDLMKDGQWSRWAYRLSPLGLAVQAHLRAQDDADKLEQQSW